MLSNAALSCVIVQLAFPDLAVMNELEIKHTVLAGRIVSTSRAGAESSVSTTLASPTLHPRAAP